MRPFDYVPCATVVEACAVLAERGEGARVLAGGTDLLVELRRAEAKPPRAVVDISRIPGLAGVEPRDGRVWIGPLTTHAELARCEALRGPAAFLAAAAAAVGSPPIRNRGTVGGNVMNAATCADTVPPLVALGARLTLASARDRREVDIADFFVKPYLTCARPNELLVSIVFPAPRPGARSAFVKLGRRNALSIARLSVAAMVERSEAGLITDARIVPGAALPVWRRVREAEALLLGRPPAPERFAAAGRAVADAMIGATGRRWSSEYKEPVIAVLVRRALEACCA
jgi:CO/xanthine dehydrogenase FAD-binding subunit